MEVIDDTANADMSEYWNGDGGLKWVNFQNRIDESLTSFGHRAMANAAIKAGEHVLDIGCGCGDTSFEIANRVGPTGSVQGVDISEIILSRAKNRKTLESHNNIKFEKADAQLHNFPNEAFDLVFSRYGIMFFEDPAAAFSNLRQALKPGGRLAFICWQSLKNNQWVNLPVSVAANHIQLPAPPEPEEPGAFSFGETSRINHILAAAGFMDIFIEEFNTKFKVGSSLDEAVSFLSKIGPASAAMEADEVEDKTRNRFAHDLKISLERFLSADGVLLDASAWIVTAKKP